LERDRKRKRGLNYFVYVSCGIAKHLTTILRVKAHVNVDVSIQTFTLGRLFFNFGEISGDKIQADASISICL